MKNEEWGMKNLWPIRPMTWLESRSSPDRGVYRINTPRQEAFVMLNGVKHLRCVHVDVHEILRFCSGWHYTIIINLWQWITPLSYEKVLNYAIPWGIGLRGAVQLFLSRMQLHGMIYAYIFRLSVTALQYYRLQLGEIGFS